MPGRSLIYAKGWRVPCVLEALKFTQFVALLAVRMYKYLLGAAAGVRLLMFSAATDEGTKELQE